MSSASGLIVPGLSHIADGYDAILCDVWGVIHNGVALFDGPVDALRNFRQKSGGTVVLITNAPRPSPPIIEQLDRLGFPREAYDAIVTSGDVTVSLLQTEKIERIYHIGPERDHTLFDDLNVARVAPEDTDTIVCTGLFDDVTETAEDYREALTAMAKRGMRMICANPDVVVERGSTLIYCAGALAGLYDELGGETVRLGKPFGPIYNLARQRAGAFAGSIPSDDRILAIGDGMFTDIKGANGAGLPTLFVTSGIHHADFGPVESPDARKVADRLAAEGLQAVAAVTRLKW